MTPTPVTPSPDLQREAQEYADLVTVAVEGWYRYSDLSMAYIAGHKKQLQAATTEIHKLNMIIDHIGEELQELRDWKEQALKVMPDLQGIGKALGVKLGESVHDKILPGIIRYKEALTRIIKDSAEHPAVQAIAKEALSKL